MKFLYYIFVIVNIYKAEIYFIQNQKKPICANCKFYISNKNECSKFGVVNITTGKHTYEPANSVRTNNDKCGEYARFFKKNNFKFITIPYSFLLENGTKTFPLIYLFPFAILQLYFIKIVSNL